MKQKSLSIPSTLFLSSFFSISGVRAQTVAWEDKANGQLLFNCNGGLPGGERYAPDNNNWSQSRVVSANPCSDNPPIARDVQLSNWTADSAPNSSAVDVVLAGSSPLTVLNINASVATLSVASTNELRIDGTNTLDVFGGTIVNDGRISLDDRTADFATLRINSNTLLSGAGTLYFNSNDDNVISSSDPAHVLTVAAAQTLLTSPDAVAGDSASRIIAALRNEGRITASQGALQLDTNPKFNTSTIEAISGGKIVLRNVTVDNTGGLLVAGASSTFGLDNATVTGGILQGLGQFTVTLNHSATFAGPLTIAPDATVFVNGSGNNLFLTGTVTNNGTLRILDAGANLANLEIVGNVSLLGSGQILLDGNDDSRITSTAPEDVLTIGPDQKVNTTAVTQFDNARIIAAFTNEGTITANEGDLHIQTNPKTNNSLIQAIGGGEILFEDVTIGNAGGTIRADSGSRVQLDNAIINGGLLDGGGRFDVIRNGGGTLNGPLAIAAGTIVSVNTSDVLNLSGTITNNGSLEITDQVTGLAYLRIVGDVTLAGSGQVLFLGNQDDILDSANPADVLTIGPDQEITTSSVTQFAARFIASFTNEGTITANVGDLRIDTNPKTNNSLIQAIGGGEILFEDVTIANANGTIRADASSSYELDNATINGGVLDGGGRFDVNRNGNAVLNGPLAIGAGTIVSVNTSDVLTLSGTITNDGSLEITDETSGFAVLRIAGNVTLNGSGRILFLGNDDDILDSTDPADTLTIGPDQEVTTSPVARAGSSATSFRARTINNGTISANIGGLRIETGPKTNNGVFRAAGGGTFEFLVASVLLTNYAAGTGTLTGGRYEAIGSGSTMILQNVGITEIAPGTEVVLSGAGASIPALSSLQRLNGTFSLRNGANLSIPHSLVVNGHLEFGLGNSGTTFLNVIGEPASPGEPARPGNLDLTGAVLDIVNLGATDGSYQVITATGTITGVPTLGNIPPGLSVSVLVDGGSVFVNITVNVITAPEILRIARDAGTGVVTITYQSINGEVFHVEGNTDLSSVWQLLPDTAVGNGGIITYMNTPPSGAERYFYRMGRNF